MKFLIVTFAPTLKKEDKFYSYAPYVYEMNLWSKYITELGIVSPIVYADKLLLSSFEKQPKIFPIQSISFVSVKSFFWSLYRIPLIIVQLFKAMQWADHIHVRCPGNIGLLGCIVQVAFPNKPKTVKYAGNWDPKSKQPFSYQLQKWIVSNTFLTRNTKVLVYGEWPNQSKNIVPFFTATYSDEEIRHPQTCTERSRSVDWGSHDLENDGQIPNHPSTPLRNQVRNDEREKNLPKPVLIDSKINFLFVGALTKGKQPLLSVKVVHELKKKGYQVQLDLYGEGVEREAIETYIKEYKLETNILLHGNVSKEIIKRAYQKAHFLLFISKSEGWPKVVAEAMFWGCLPITSAVSCVPYMLDNGNRGAIVHANVDEITLVAEGYLNDNEKYVTQVKKAMEWSRYYTLEKFEEEIGKVLV